MDVPRDATNLRMLVYVTDDAGDPIVDLAHDNADLAVSSMVAGASSFTALTLVAGTAGTYLASSWVHIANGYYQFCPANALIVAGTSTAIRLKYSTNRAINGTINAIATKNTPDTVTIGAIGAGLQQQLNDNLTTLAYTRQRSTDWAFRINVGDISAGDWTEILFTIKASPIDDADSAAIVQVKLTNGGDAGDGLLTVDGSSYATKADGSITVFGDDQVDILVLAEATALVDATEFKFWGYTGPITQDMKDWRRSEAAVNPVPPVYQFDVKVLNGDGSANTVASQGTLIVPEIVTRTVS